MMSKELHCRRTEHTLPIYHQAGVLQPLEQKVQVMQMFCL
jgi:uncharacterized membrane protein